MDRKFLLSAFIYGLLGLFILYGGYTARETIEPLLGGASIISLVAFVLMGWMLVRQAGNSS